MINQKLAKDQSSTIAVRGVSFETDNGLKIFDGLTVNFGEEKSGLVGKNGIGKTTFLKIIGR